MENVRVVFMGTPVFARGILESLLENNYNVVGVVTQPDKKVGRKQVIQFSEVKQCAVEHDIPVFQPINIKEDYQQVLDWNPDIIVTCAYGQFVPSVVCDAPKHLSINVHASLLPKYRGGAPIHKVIINGETKTGISIMRMVKKMDAGEVYAMKEVVIGEDDTTEILHDKLMGAGKELLIEMLPDYLAGKITGVAQDESEATVAYNVSKEEEFISFKKEDVHTAYNHIRGLISWPVGYGLLEGKRIKFHEVKKVVVEHSHELGEVVQYKDKAFWIACKGGYVVVSALQPEGKGKMSSEQYYNGAGKNVLHKCFE